MSESPSRPDREQWEQQWVDSLLETTFESDSDQRLDRVLRHIEQASVAHLDSEAAETVPPTVSPGTRGLGSRLWWALMSTAAILLISFFILPVFQSTSASATLKRTLLTAQQNVPRHYRMEVIFQGEKRETLHVNGDLYVQGNDRLAVRIPAILNPTRNAWAGHQGDRAWVVPGIGPVMVGNRKALGDWLGKREEISTPYLHLSTLLARVAESYRLERRPAETLPRNRSTEALPDHGNTMDRLYERLVAKALPGQAERLPDEAHLWIDSQTGMVHRLEAHWNLAPDAVGRKSIQLQWLSDETLPVDWFEHQAHHHPRRRVKEWN